MGEARLRVLTADEMRAVDRRAIEEWGIPALVLMENAARGVADAVRERYGGARRILIFCGPGNNGGDGLAIARHLALSGLEPRLVTVGWSRNRSDDARRQLDICRRQGLPIEAIESSDELGALGPEGLAADLWIDALFGTGLTRPLEGVFAEVVRWLASGLVPVVAVDLPSGLDASIGTEIGPSARADLTVTFRAPKHAHVFSPAADRCGEVIVADLGIPDRVLDEVPGKLHRLVARELARELVDPPPRAHKGSFGHCLVVAGSPGKSGAALLATRAAVIGGAGLVTVAVPEPLLDALDTGSAESMTAALAADAAGRLTVDATDEVLRLAEGKACLAIGPGLGRRGSTVEVVRRLLESSSLPIVLDADGLNALVGVTESLLDRDAPTILTPHPGEAARLFGLEVAEIESRRVEVVREHAERLGAVIVLKGHQSLVAAPDGNVWVNESGNPAMGTGGTGDVLTGLIAALVSRNYDAVVAARLAVHLHGLAGDLALREGSVESVTASDLLGRLGDAFRRLRSS